MNPQMYFDMRNLFVFITFFIFSILKMVSLASENEMIRDERGKRIIRSTYITSKIKIDGKFNETVWKQVQFQGDFLQREPKEGQPATELTEVAILHNDEYLYIGIKCYDSNPEKILARERRRDAFMENDDYFEIVLDTYRDHRNGFYFVINPTGCRRDATFSEEGRNMNSEWDGIWDCGVEITQEGWFAEIEIPWKTLRFAESDDHIWGINFARMIRRKNEHDFWQLISRDAGRYGFFRLSQAGTLVGLSHLTAGGNIEFEPYLLGGAEKDAETDFNVKTVDDIGVDAKINLTSNLAVNLTWNTDFAQVEADQERINLSRFSLYFPEKREFFLDGAEVFNFGGQSMSGRRGGETDGIRLFYSRRIGIVDGHQQPISGGVKMIGKIGKYQVGILNMLTEKTVIKDEDDDSLETFPATNFTVLRLKRELLKRSNVGIMFLNRQSLSDNDYHRSVGFDANFPLTDLFSISGSLAATTGPDKIEDSTLYRMNRRNWAGNLSLEYRSDLWDLELSHLDIQENFNAESVRQLRFRLSGEYMTDHQNIMQENNYSTSFGIRFQNSAFLYIGLRREAEFIPSDWEVRPGYIIPEDTYYGWSTYVFFSSDRSKEISGGLRTDYSDYYTGRKFTFDPELTLLNLQKTRIEIDLNFNKVWLPQGSFNAKTFASRIYYYFSTKLYIKAYLQWKDDRLANDGNL